jgi:hypothetical protein
MAKRRVGNQSVNLIPDHYKLGITLIYLHAGGVPHIVEKILMKATILL